MQDEEHIRNTLARIEAFLLPPMASQGLNESLKDFPSTPVERLDQILFQLAVADHVRTMQTVYRDSFDEQFVAAELRGSPKNDRVPTKDLLQRIADGRSRALALIKLCCGPHSIALVRSHIDLANAYALQGMWQQAEERVLQGMEALVFVESSIKSTTTYVHSRQLGMEAAKRVNAVYACLRKHVVRNCGQVRSSFLKELLHDLSDAVNSPDSLLSHPTKLFSSLNDFFTTSSSKVPLKQLTKSYFADQHTIPKQNSQRTEEIKTWGDIVDFLRHKCETMRAWVQSAMALFLPQTKAQLAMPFRLCDPSARQLANPVQLASALAVFPSVARIISGTNLAKLLVQLRTEVPLVVSAQTGSVQVLPPMNTSGSGSAVQGVHYELPTPIEEYYCTFLLQSNALSFEQQMSLLKVQALTLKGVCCLHLSTVALAEEVLLKGLQELETSGLETEAVACELYNSIAQMMITKHQQWLAGKKDRLAAEAAVWVQDTEEGRRAVRVAVRSIKRQYSYRSQPVSTAEMELTAKDQAIAQRVRQLQESDEDMEAGAPMRQSLEAAYRYLVKSFEIAEATHGPLHPVVGTACLAVASAQNLLKDLESTREWLLRAIRVFEKCQPLPGRAITFAQIQLSHALGKLGHEDEARRVLNKAAQFHLAQARAMLTAHLSKGRLTTQGAEKEDAEPNPETARSTGSSSVGTRSVRVAGAPLVAGERGAHWPPLPLSSASRLGLDVDPLWPLILKGSPLHDEIQTSVTLLGQVVKLSIKLGEKWEASLLAEEAARLLEEAYGWDSVEAAEATRQVGLRCLDIEDWPRAVRFLNLSIQAHSALYNKSDPRYLSVSKLLEEAKTRRSQGAKGLIPDDQLLDETQESSALAEAKEDRPVASQPSSKKAVAKASRSTSDDLEAIGAEPRIATSKDGDGHLHASSAQSGAVAKDRRVGDDALVES